jgi:Holliday junction DNA helicase RuvA
MIGYIEGKILTKDDDRILVLANQVGYEVLLPAVVMRELNQKPVGQAVSLFIYYHQSERQPRPVLIGFNSLIEREFFQYFISVEDIGPLKAVKALNLSIAEIAEAIESKNIDKLKQLKGIGDRTAHKIIASLYGRVKKFVQTTSQSPEKTDNMTADFIHPVLDVLITQLGHKTPDAKQMIKEAMERNRKISTPEELFDEVYRGSGT